MKIIDTAFQLKKSVNQEMFEVELQPLGDSTPEQETCFIAALALRPIFSKLMALFVMLLSGMYKYFGSKLLQLMTIFLSGMKKYLCSKILQLFFTIIVSGMYK